jgi:hypothetical protein
LKSVPKGRCEKCAADLPADGKFCWEQRWGGLQGAIWTLGIAVIAVFNWWWPGMLVLVGLSAILGAISRNHNAKTS